MFPYAATDIFGRPLFPVSPLSAAYSPAFASAYAPSILANAAHPLAQQALLCGALANPAASAWAIHPALAALSSSAAINPLAISAVAPYLRAAINPAITAQGLFA